MRQPLDVQRKLRQLDNDVQSIYEMLTGIAGTQLRHGNRLDELAEQLDHHGERLDQIDGKLDRHDERLDQIDGKLDSIIGMLGDR